MTARKFEGHRKQRYSTELLLPSEFSILQQIAAPAFQLSGIAWPTTRLCLTLLQTFLWKNHVLLLHLGDYVSLFFSDLQEYHFPVSRMLYVYILKWEFGRFSFFFFPTYREQCSHERSNLLLTDARLMRIETKHCKSAGIFLSYVPDATLHKQMQNYAIQAICQCLGTSPTALLTSLSAIFQPYHKRKYCTREYTYLPMLPRRFQVEIEVPP